MRGIGCCSVEAETSSSVPRLVGLPSPMPGAPAHASSTHKSCPKCPCAWGRAPGSAEASGVKIFCLQRDKGFHLTTCISEGTGILVFK